MNNQIAMAVEKTIPDDWKLLIKEIFYSIQGEGPFSGRPATFVRLGGCNLQCGVDWTCDTDYSDGIRMSVLNVVNEVKRIGKSRLVVITGGEPFRQALLNGLCSAFLMEKMEVQIETNGTCYQKGFSSLAGQVSVVCSPKAAKIHNELCPMVSAVKLLVKKVNHQTFVCYHNSSELLAVALSRWKKFKIYLQPIEDEHSQDNLDATIAACLDHDLPISLQLHKVLNLR